MQKNIDEYILLETKDKERWNTIVKSFDYDVFYLCEYAKAFELEWKEKAYLFYYNVESTRAINVFLKRDISECDKLKNKLKRQTFFDITSQYGYGGFIVEGEEIEKVNNSFIECMNENNIISEIVRFGLENKYKEKYYGEIKNVKFNVVRNILEPEQMFYDFEYKVRKNINKAKRNNLKVEIDYTGKTLNDFLDVYYDTMDRNSAEREYYFSKEFFKTLFEMRENVVIFNVLYEENIISTELVLYDKNNCYSFLGGTLKEYYSLRPNEFLKFEIMKWAYEKNISKFILGGGYTNSLDDGILRYKKSFSPNDELVSFYIGKKVFNKDTYEKLVELRKGENLDENFFPRYRA